MTDEMDHKRELWVIERHAPVAMTYWEAISLGASTYRPSAELCAKQLRENSPDGVTIRVVRYVPAFED